MKNAILILTLFMLIGCTLASEEDLVDVTELPMLVTYNGEVKSIIDNNCISCHTNPPVSGAPMSLLTYVNVKEAVQNRGLLDRISSQDLGFLMPFGGPRLPQNLIDTIYQWEADGLLEE